MINNILTMVRQALLLGTLRTITVTVETVTATTKAV